VKDFKCDLLELAERKQKLIDKKLCLNCLSTGHYARECKSSTCKMRDKKHILFYNSKRMKKSEVTLKSNRPTRIHQINCYDVSKCNTTVESLQVSEQSSNAIGLIQLLQRSRWVIYLLREFAVSIDLLLWPV